MELVLATTIWMRLTGLLRKDRCTNGEMLMLAPCKSIHTFGLRCPVDVAFLDDEGKVVASERNIPPAKIRSHPKAEAVLERRSNPAFYWPTTGDSMSVSFVQPAKQAERKVAHENL